MMQNTKSGQKEVTTRRVRAFTVTSDKPNSSQVPLIVVPSKLERKNSLMTYSNLMKETNVYVEKLKLICTDIDRKIIRNVLAYTRQLIKPGHDDLDENIFNAQISKFFKITDTYLLSRIYSVIRSKKKGQNCNVLHFAELCCIFISADMLPKIDYAFRVYDVRGSGVLSTADLEAALRPLIQYTHIVSTELSSTQSSLDLTSDDINKKMLKEIVTLLLNMIDSNNDRSIDLEEFHDIVLRYPLMLECLGPCLPDKADTDKFIKIMEDKSTFEVSAYFRHERRLSLNDPVTDQNIYDKLYPFQLEFP